MGLCKGAFGKGGLCLAGGAEQDTLSVACSKGVSSRTNVFLNGSTSFSFLAFLRAFCWVGSSSTGLISRVLKK